MSRKYVSKRTQRLADFKRAEKKKRLEKEMLEAAKKAFDAKSVPALVHPNQVLRSQISMLALRFYRA